MKRLLYRMAIVPLVFMLMIVVHEAVQGMTAKIFGKADSEVYIWPGYQLYPGIGAIPSYLPGTRLGLRQSCPR